jgi:hypothetical protein
MASIAASGEPGSTPGRGGTAKWLIGSAMPQNISSEPTPAANIMVNQTGPE